MGANVLKIAKRQICLTFSYTSTTAVPTIFTIHLKPEKCLLFGWSLPILVIMGSIPTPTPTTQFGGGGGRGRGLLHARLVNLNYEKTRVPSHESGEDRRCTDTPMAGDWAYIIQRKTKAASQPSVNKILCCYNGLWIIIAQVLSYQCREWILYVIGWSAHSCLLCQPVVQPILSQDSSSLHLLCEQAAQWHLQ